MVEDVTFRLEWVSLREMCRTSFYTESSRYLEGAARSGDGSRCSTYVFKKGLDRHMKRQGLQ